MKAAFIKEAGPPENITYGDVETPEPTGSEVLVKVSAVSVNPIDTYIRNGANFWELPDPFIVGCDLAGTVEKVGPQATRFQVGDRVWGSNQGLFGRQGSFADYVASDQEWLYPTPDGVDDETVAAIALVGITAHLGLVPVLKLQPGESLFINGGSGGIGSTVIQMAKTLGAKVIATGGTDEKLEICKRLGADVAINYKTEDVAAAVKNTCPDGVNVFWETRREQDLDFMVDLVAERGRMVIMAGRGARPELPVGPFYVKGCTLHGFAMLGYSQDEQRASAEAINAWLTAGQLRARIDRVLPLAEAATAHRLQEDSTVGLTGTIAGKLVLKP